MTAIVGVTGRRMVRYVRHNPLLPVLIILLAVMAGLYDGFATVANFRNIAVQASPLIIASVGMTYVIMTSGIDLSVGSILFLAAAIETSNALADRNTAVVFVGVLASTTLMGAINGTAVAMTRVPALIVTLATMQVFRGAGGHITRQQNITVPADLRWIGTGTWLGIPAPVLVAVLVVAIGVAVLARTVFGRYLQAVGSSQASAEGAGLPVRLVLVGAYTVAGLLAGIAALIQTARLGAVQPSIGQGYELTVITAVVLGGTSLFGGRGSVGGSVLGALVLTTVQTGLVYSNASPYIFDIIRGGVLLAAVLAAGTQWRTLLPARHRRTREPHDAAPAAQ